MFFFDPIYLLFIAPGLIIALIAQGLLWYAYGKYSGVNAGSNLTGIDAAKKINQNEGFGVSMQVTPGKLNDYYNPVDHLVNVSEDNATNQSVANIAVVAHEFGHVEQKVQGSNLFRIRSFMVPAVNIGSQLGIILVIAGLAISFTGLAWLGVILFGLTTIFSLVTLPIEIDASVRGMRIIKKHNLISHDKLGGAKWVLTAAAMTYFAGLIQSIGQLAYYAMLVSGRGRE